MRKTLTQIFKIQFILCKWPNINFSLQEQHSKSEKKKSLICTRFIQCEASNVKDCVYVYWNSNLFNFSVISMILACEFDTIIVSDARARYIKWKIRSLRLFICYLKQHTSVSSKWHMFTNQHHQIFCHLHPFVYVAYSTHRTQNPIFLVLTFGWMLQWIYDIFVFIYNADGQKLCFQWKNKLLNSFQRKNPFFHCKRILFTFAHVQCLSFGRKKYDLL